MLLRDVHPIVRFDPKAFKNPLGDNRAPSDRGPARPLSNGGVPRGPDVDGVGRTIMRPPRKAPGAMRPCYHPCYRTERISRDPRRAIAA